ncbi:MAG: hypothetical protein JWN68_3074 [Nocardioides sp.]|jgi:hypothetical protein|uniref:hypothetical protein n=1 Tax=Nocardioides sp. TaxID=35761 RepID=UPI00260D028C|nr:hypothetical protein [Nocardioides sp.]MCW2835121.1 hypothetical protein [Nocardioides sp.]
MTVTYNRAVLTSHWAGDGGVNAIDDQTTVHLWIDLLDAPAEPDVAAALDRVLRELNDRRLDWDDEFEQGSQGRVSIPLADTLAIGVCGTTWGVAPTEYLDGLCEALTALSWSGRLRLHVEARRVWVPYGPEPTITTMLGYGLAPCPNGQGSSPCVWRDQPALRSFLADLALEWVNAAQGPLTYIGDAQWQPTSRQARDLLDIQLGEPSPSGIELGRLIGDRPDRQQDGHFENLTGRTGRTAVFAMGYLTLTENDAGRTLTERLADHHSLLTRRSHPPRYGLTTGTIGHGRLGAMAVHGERLSLRGERVYEVPHQRPGHTDGLPDAYYAQLFDSRMLDRSGADLGLWNREDFSEGHVVLSAAAPEPWFAVQPAPNDPRPHWITHDAEPSTLADARAGLGSLLQQPEAKSVN